MLNCYVHPPNPDLERRIAATGVVERCVQIARAARKARIRIFYANGSYRADASDYGCVITDSDMELRPWPEGPQLMEPGPAIEGTRGAEVIEEISPQPGEYLIPKHRWSAFGGTHLDILLRGLQIDTLLVAGGSTDVGIVATAYSARDLGYHLIILRDACQSQRPGAQDFCMGRLFPRMARVMLVDDAIALINTAR
jgi:ureidoacrylate peracid hydrolase